MNYRNEIKTIGRIASIKDYTEGYSRITLAIKAREIIYPSFICKKELIPEHKKHAYVEVIGYADSMHKNNGQYVPRMKITDIKLAPTLLEKEFGVKGRFCEKEYCKLYISGKIKDVSENGDYVKYIVVTKNPETEEDVDVLLDWKKIERHPDFFYGDEVCAICKVVTPRKTIGTEERIFLNFHVFDMELMIN